MKISQKGLGLIKEFEGFRDKAYFCAAGKQTIGYGHVVKLKEAFVVITKKEAEELLKSDIEWAEDCINNTVVVKLTQNQFDALVSLVFNIGSVAFEKSTLRKKLNAGDYKLAAEQFLLWNKVKGLVNRGLTNRRIKERALFNE